MDQDKLKTLIVDFQIMTWNPFSYTFYKIHQNSKY